MSLKPLVMARDTEKLVKEYLAPRLPDATVAIGVPANWTADSTPHLQIASDGDPIGIWPVATRCTIRLVARAGSTSAAKDLCALAQGLLCAHNGDSDITTTRYLTGVLPSRDPETHAEVASATVRVTVRTELIETGS